MAPFEALYDRRCRSPIGWFMIGEVEMIGPGLVHQAMEKFKIIKERLKTPQSYQKSDSDGIMRFGKKGKLNSMYVRPYRIIQRISQVAYRLELPPKMSLVHPIFHVSILKGVVGDPSLIVPVETIEVNEELTYEEVPIAMLDRQLQKLRNKEIASVKVLRRNQQVEEATWEAEEEMKKKYPHLFE
ncbi:uncharacterized protein [Nicotiana tomentosiformis]|uniref:uncharacterized protein n=1 Tax=Nicotiana tomentosiformis TaxID=4098 RepID=UPI00388CA759